MFPIYSEVRDSQTVRIHAMPTTLLEGTENKPSMDIHGDMEKELRM